MKKTGLSKWVCLVSALLVLTACAAPADETWVQIVSIGGSDEDDPASSVGTSDLQSGTTDTADVTVQNTTVILGASDSGVSITVYHARVEYFVQGQNLPSYEYVVTLFLPPPSSGDAGASSSTATLQEFPLVPVALKNWILNPANFPAEIAAAGFSGEARITLRARTEEGRELETSAGVTVIFN
jgi:hypothetical protein